MNDTDEKRQPTTGRIRIAVDVMGSDRGPGTIGQGAIDAALYAPDRVEITLIGNESKIGEFIQSQQKRPKNVRIAHAEAEIQMCDSPSEAVKIPNTSVAVGMNLQKSGKVDALVSAGNTGAVMAGSLLTLGRLRGVNRPAIMALFPTGTSKKTVVLDVGANNFCRPINLYQFAHMGSAFCSQMYDIKEPTVGLLSIGEERMKGNELILGSHDLIANSNMNFAGNVEGRDILEGSYDVVVTDGFTGNIILKFAESIEPFLTTRLKKQVSTNMFSRVGAALMYPFLGRLRRAFDYAETGGAVLLGVNGVVIICHGSSSARAIKNAISLAIRMVEKRVVENIKTELHNEGNYASIRTSNTVSITAAEKQEETLRSAHG